MQRYPCLCKAVRHLYKAFAGQMHQGFSSSSEAVFCKLSLSCQPPRFYQLLNLRSSNYELNSAYGDQHSDRPCRLLSHKVSIHTLPVCCCHSTGILLSIVFVFLACQPSSRQRLRNEISSLGSKQLDYDSLKFMEYVYSCLKESMSIALFTYVDSI